MKTNQLRTNNYYPADSVLTGPEPDSIWIGFKVDIPTQLILDCKWVANASEPLLNELALFSDRVVGNLLEPSLTEGALKFRLVRHQKS